MVAIATSAGGLQALREILAGLNSTFPVPILVVQHLSRNRDSITAEILDKKRSLRSSRRRMVLVLGRAEMISGYGKAFVPLDLKRRVFARGPKREARDRLMLLAQAGDHERLGQLTNHVRAREMVFEGASIAQIMVDSTGLLVLANARAREIFGLEPAEVGRPFQDLDLSCRPAQLQQLMEQAQREERKICISGVEWQGLGEHMYLDIDIVPLHYNGSRVSRVRRPLLRCEPGAEASPWARAGQPGARNRH